MKKALIAVFALASLAAAPSQAAPQTYIVDSEHTFPRFSYSHHGLSRQASRFDKTTGTIVLDQAAHTASVDLTIDLTAISTASGHLDEFLQEADFFDTARYPTATFKSTNVRFSGDTPVEVDGILTIKGISQPVTLKITHFATMPHPLEKRDAIGANAIATIKRSDFGMGQIPTISDEVELDISLEAISR